MDLLCQRCGEPYDVFSVTDEMTPEEQGRFNCGEGCPCCYGKPEEEFKGRAARTRDAREAQAAMRSVLGDDLDGLAGDMEDFGFT